MVHKTTIKRNQLLKESLFATLFMLALVFLISFIPFKFEFLKVIRQGFLDIDVYDLYYSGKHDSTKRDENIVLVELAQDRDSIARQINIINDQHPAVIAVDAIFEAPRDRAKDSLLVEAINKANNIVLSSILSRSGSREFVRHNFFERNTKKYSSGYTNFFGGPFSVIRSYVPFAEWDHEEYPSFTSRIVESYSGGDFQKLEDRHRKIELINYSGNLEHYTALSLEDLHYYSVTGQLSYLFKNKIVLLGFFKKQPPLLLDDLNFSPLNDRLVGKSFPDMYGIVVHANILSMILSKNYASLAPPAVSYLCAYIITFFLLYYILKQHATGHHPSHLKFLAIQVAAIIIVFYLFLQIYYWFQVKVPLLTIIISLVISVELFELYEKLAFRLHRKWKFKTIFRERHNI